MLVTHRHWADIGFPGLRPGSQTGSSPDGSRLSLGSPQNTDPRDRTGLDWVISAIGDMGSIETLELRGIGRVNSHVQRFLGGIHMETPTSPSKTRFRNLKRLVLCDVSSDATALAEFMEIQKRGADSLGAYGHYTKAVFQGTCEGRKSVFRQQCPQELAQQTPNTNCQSLRAGSTFQLNSLLKMSIAIIRNTF